MQIYGFFFIFVFTNPLNMNGEISRKTIWDSAGKGGLILGGITIGFMALSLLLNLLPDNSVGTFLSTILNFIIWAAKLFCCVYVLFALMRKFTLDFPGADKATVRKFGVITGFTSALIYSAFTLVYFLYINPDALAESFAAATEAYSGMLDSNSMQALDQMQGSMPAIMFFGNLVYCTLFGWAASAIIASRLVKDDPFKQ